MAGATSTRLVCHLAMDKGKPIIPIPCFGGASEDLFEFFRYRYAKIKVDDKPVVALLGSWRNGTDEQVVKIAEILFKKHQTQSSHTYFISYSWKDCVSADHIETLLRREHRPILRDEADIQAGEPISNRVHALIEVCDTFIALWSSQYSQSQWCTAELEYAAKLLHTKKIKRVILLNLDNHPLSLLQANQLSEPATTRRDRELAILKMTRDEVS
ncbi:MAG: toll/interleukin-1 receptor domain-containing protein [Magnetococcales bacterium]|nr:toll/interleukin-1 receptor domain-containing protein [Magnetococcales bacterium]